MSLSLTRSSYIFLSTSACLRWESSSEERKHRPSNYSPLHHGNHSLTSLEGGNLLFEGFPLRLDLSLMLLHRSQLPLYPLPQPGHLCYLPLQARYLVLSQLQLCIPLAVLTCQLVTEWVKQLSETPVFVTPYMPTS